MTLEPLLWLHCSISCRYLLEYIIGIQYVCVSISARDLCRRRLGIQHTLEPLAWHWSHWPCRSVNPRGKWLFSEGKDPVGGSHDCQLMRSDMEIQGQKHAAHMLQACGLGSSHSGRLCLDFRACLVQTEALVTVNGGSHDCQVMKSYPATRWATRVSSSLKSAGSWSHFIV